MRTSEIVGQALRLPSFAVWHRQAGRLPYKLSLCLFLLSACSTPRVVEVSSRTRLQDIDAADKSLFGSDAVSRLRYEPRDLPADAQREEFFVRWSSPSPRSRGSRVRETPLSFAAKGQGEGSSIDLVKFEYRQVDKPDVVLEQTLVLSSVCHPELVEGSLSLSGKDEIPRQARNDNLRCHIFEIRGEDFRAGGPVSAWRVSLWKDGNLLAEKKSALW